MHQVPVLARLLLWLLLLPSMAVAADRPAPARAPIRVGFDGEYGLINSTSAQSIEQGIRVAMAEINGAGGVLGGRPLELVTRDNRSVPARGIANLRELAAMPDLVAVVGGRFSPVMLEQVPLIHELGIPLLDAWGSADGITAHNHRPSYTFRLSLRDALAMPVMIGHAAGKGARQLGILLPNTGWGRSNLGAAEAYVASRPGLILLPPVWYNWGEDDMLHHYQALRQAGAEAVLLVANDIEGSLLVRQVAALPVEARLPIVCHWGVTGGRFVEQTGPGLFDLDFTVVQTFAFGRADPEVRARVLASTRGALGIGQEGVHSPVGFAHAYDLIHLLARAIELAGSPDRAAVRDALERVEGYRGLTGVYPHPFTPEDHDALEPAQVFMARYLPDGTLEPAP